METMTLSNFLKGYLQEWNINQDTLAEDIGVSVNTLRDWIYKGKDANETSLEKLKGYFDGDVRFKHYLDDRDAKTQSDPVNRPNHYQGLKGLEVREVMENFVPKYDRYGGLVSCDIKDAIKYILRAPDKNGLEDLKKAQRMIKYVIDNWDGEPE